MTERMVSVPVEWHREDAEHCRLIYSLMQKGWRKGQPVMVNDVMIRIETCNGSDTDIGPITDAIQSALTAAPVREEVWAEAGIGDEFMVGPRGGMESRLCPDDRKGRRAQPPAREDAQPVGGEHE